MYSFHLPLAGACWFILKFKDRSDMVLSKDFSPFSNAEKEFNTKTQFTVKSTAEDRLCGWNGGGFVHN